MAIIRIQSATRANSYTKLLVGNLRFVIQRCDNMRSSRMSLEAGRTGTPLCRALRAEARKGSGGGRAWQLGRKLAAVGSVRWVRVAPIAR